MDNTEAAVTLPAGYETHTLYEILTQPDAWRAALTEVEAKRDIIRALWTSGQFSEIIVTGCGSTHYLSQAVAPLLQQQLGIRARPVPASELLLFPETLLTPGSRPLLFTISRSGHTTETIRATQAFKQQYPDQEVVTVGCYPESELVALSDLALVVSEGQEQSVVQTRSFSAMLVTSQAAAALAHESQFEAMQALPELGERLIATYQPLAQQLGQNQQFERFYFLGSGLQYGLASEANLKMKEMSLSISEAFHFMEFRHGPMSMVNDHTLIVALLSDQASAYELAVLREMRALGAHILIIADKPVMASAGYDYVAFNSGLPETQRGVLYLPVLQMLGYYRARTNGQNPDQPHNLTAIIVLEQ